MTCLLAKERDRADLRLTMGGMKMSQLTSLFEPQAVAVIGASNKAGKLGHTVIRNLIECGYPGRIYPVNPGAQTVLGYPAYPSIEAVPGPVDLAVIVIPAPGVVEVARRCGEKGVRYLVVITAGFKEIGSEGSKRERDLAAVCQRYGMGLVGPNCLGIIDTHTPLNVTFAPRMPRRGNIAFFSQSGALGAAILDWSVAVDLGFSRFVSLGNKAGLDEVDFIAAAATDPKTEVILCYLENISDGARFVHTAREVTREKPIIVIKSGVSQAGARAASSHTGALAGSDVAYETAFRQCGVFRAESMEELFDLALAFAGQPLPRGKRVAVVTNAGGPGILASDAIELNGLEMARFARETTEGLRASLPPEASIYNPVDVLGDAMPERYAVALEYVARDANVDSILVLLTPQAGTMPEETARLMIETHRRYPDKVMAAALMGGETVERATVALKQAGIPAYFAPERAVAAVAGLTRYAGFRRGAARRQDGLTFAGLKPETVEEVFRKVRQDRRVILLGHEAAAVVEAYGVPCAATRLATGPEEAVAAAEAVGFPVVLKVASPQIVHKTDVGGVKVGLKTPEAVYRGYLDILESVHRHLPQAEVYGVEVQRMMPPGIELIVGVTRDLQFGPLLMFGLGGIYVDLLRDVSFRLTHGLSREEVKEMVRETKAYTLLRGYRGQAPGDIEALVDALCRVARLVEDFPAIVEMDINPVFAYAQGLAALDVKITIA